MAVACIASAMLLLEIVVTRLFSVLFFYHFSFFAISLVMSGLVIGGIVAARLNPRDGDVEAFEGRLSVFAAVFSAATLAALVYLSFFARPDVGSAPSLPTVALYALLFLPGLVAAGAFLALAFARDRAWIGQLYAWDLIAAAIACLSAIWLLRTLQGPAVLVVPALLSAVGAVVLANARWRQALGGVLAVTAAGLLVANVATGSSLLRLRPSSNGGQPLFERWNEHSRIQAFDAGASGRYLVIDRSAGTMMRALPPRPDGQPVVAEANWGEGSQYPVYGVGRPVRNVAIIGVGGGQDLLPAIWNGATRVDGYELNGILIDLLERDFTDFNALTSRPEVHLIHSEARVGIGHSGMRYDVIQASLIDTWAATASGGFVLSENGLYTREGWQTFLAHLSDTGVLTMTRWHLPDAPAETHRLVSLAAAGLGDVGISDPRDHVVLIRSNRDDKAVAFTAREGSQSATILVSLAPFTAAEVARLTQNAATTGAEILAAPGATSSDPVIDNLLNPATRQEAIDESRFNIAPPNDLKPYFFLQVRPADLVNLGRTNFGSVTEITFNGVRVMMMLGICAFLLVLLVILLTVFTLPGSHASAADRRSYRWMSLYFLGIGLGYILIQLGLHQRLIIILGHPTLALSVVLFSMLLGTGIGSAVSERLFPTGRVRSAGLVILGALALLWLGLPLFPYFDWVTSFALRICLIGLMLGCVGCVLGFAFPLGVRIVAPTGEWAIQKMWAINGAASIAASVLAALVGLTMGTQMVLLFGLLSYAVAVVAGVIAQSVPAGAGGPERAIGESA